MSTKNLRRHQLDPFCLLLRLKGQRRECSFPPVHWWQRENVSARTWFLPCLLQYIEIAYREGQSHDKEGREDFEDSTVLHLAWSNRFRFQELLSLNNYEECFLILFFVAFSLLSLNCEERRKNVRFHITGVLLFVANGVVTNIFHRVPVSFFSVSFVKNEPHFKFKYLKKLPNISAIRARVALISCHGTCHHCKSDNGYFSHDKRYQR